MGRSKTKFTNGGKDSYGGEEVKGRKEVSEHGFGVTPIFGDFVHKLLGDFNDFQKINFQGRVNSEPH